MGTRGFMGVVVDQQVKLTYNHFDSYPAGLGLDVLHYMRGVPNEEIEITRSLAKLLAPVPETDPTDTDVKRLETWTDLHVGSRTPDGRPSWYQLLRRTQGDIGAVLAAGLYEDAGEFAADSLFCEWGYLIDLDAETFEVYEGFQRAPHEKGRFAGLPQRAYAHGEFHPVALVASWPFDQLPEDDTFCSVLRGTEEE
jgi:hypothetical protein